MTQNTTKIQTEIEELEQQLKTTRGRLAQLRRELPREVIENYDLKDANGGSVTLQELFGDREDLLVIHNMGVSCPYCTLWSDGFNGVSDHLQNRAALALVSPDSPSTLKKFRESRKWEFPCISAAETSFIKDLGFESDDGSPSPGASALRLEGGQIYRISKSTFGPGDDFCAVWHLFDMLAEGSNGWQPKYNYS